MQMTCFAIISAINAVLIMLLLSRKWNSKNIDKKSVRFTSPIRRSVELIFVEGQCSLLTV